MKYPSKLFNYSESNLSKFSIILDELIQGDQSVLDLYSKVKKHFQDITTFIENLECLYILDAIEYNHQKECLTYAL